MTGDGWNQGHRNRQHVLETVYLKRHNEKFSVKPLADFDSHHPVGSLDLDATLSIQVKRVCTNDFTFSLDCRKFQIARENDLHGLPRNKLLIEKRLDGTIKARFNGRYLVIKEIDSTKKA
ncbi:MAG: hypothetical protein LBE38_02460 [Deltaproteobacteria bacterium]|nr:hypothetical protein [Deltaproteobacteria bacterium]